MRTRVIRLLDLIIDSIETMQDYVLARQITLSEGFLFSVTMGRALWFTMFGVNAVAPSPSLLLNEAWTPAFWLISAAHFGTFFLSSRLIRMFIVAAYGFLWCFLAILIAFTQIESPAFPTFVAFSILAVVITMRLYSDHRANV